MQDLDFEATGGGRAECSKEMALPDPAGASHPPAVVEWPKFAADFMT